MIYAIEQKGGLKNEGDLIRDDICNSTRGV